MVSTKEKCNPIANETYSKKSSCSIPCINNNMESLQWLL